VVRPDIIRPSCDARPAAPVNRVLRAAELTAIGAGRRLYRSEIIGPDATVNTILFHARELEADELRALDQIGERSFGICARAGVLYQQAADLLAELQ
jgi:hypothetical protein